MKKLFVSAILSINAFLTASQTISGNLSFQSQQSIKLIGFNGLKTYTISSSLIDEKGNFILQYAQKDYGVGYLISEDEKPFIVILSGENIEIKGDALRYTASIKIVQGNENKWFEKYTKEHATREKALQAWIFLEKLYTQDTFLLPQKVMLKNISTEKKRIIDEDSAFLYSLSKTSYVSWYLPLRKMLSSVPIVAQYRTEEISNLIFAFHNLDYTDDRLYKSGLLKEVIENQFWLIENSGNSFAIMQKSIDVIMNQLLNNNNRLNEVSTFLFELLESHSLFLASEYLAIKLLNEKNCTLNNDFAKQLEMYRTMKIGNKAPEIIFEGDCFAPQYEKNIPKKLSDIHSKYKLIVFGAGWCSKCTSELLEISRKYQDWQLKRIEVLFVALEEDQQNFKNFAAIFPFISVCDYKKWTGKAVKDYYVYATPSMFLLNEKQEIILRPESAKQMNAWVDWDFIQLNK